MLVPMLCVAPIISEIGVTISAPDAETMTTSRPSALWADTSSVASA
jgi:hypothetical protein